jgi:hypothetical protein
VLEKRLLAQEKEHRGAEGQDARDDAVGEHAEGGEGGEEEEQDEEPGGNSFGHVHLKFSFRCDELDTVK